MYAKVKNNVVEKYPYTTGDLKAENPQTSFPENIPEDMLAGFGVVRVSETQRPEMDYRYIVTEGMPSFVDGILKQAWQVTLRPADEASAIANSLRQKAYQKESDPLFFKWQRGEIAQEVWLAKVSEIKQRFPDN